MTTETNKHLLLITNGFYWLFKMAHSDGSQFSYLSNDYNGSDMQPPGHNWNNKYSFGSYMVKNYRQQYGHGSAPYTSPLEYLDKKDNSIYTSIEGRVFVIDYE